ncbi:hypothetical protein SNARM312S_05626 [Streptomyces narbonensis]
MTNTTDQFAEFADVSATTLLRFATAGVRRRRQVHAGGPRSSSCTNIIKSQKFLTDQLEVVEAASIKRGAGGATTWITLTLTRRPAGRA